MKNFETNISEHKPNQYINIFESHLKNYNRFKGNKLIKC